MELRTYTSRIIANETRLASIALGRPLLAQSAAKFFECDVGEGKPSSRNHENTGTSLKATSYF